MIVWCDKPELKITSDIAPRTAVRKPLPSDDEETVKDKKAKPYLNKKDVTFTIDYLGTTYIIFIPKGYKWDGASIPRPFWWLIGSKGENDFLDPSMVHDKITEKKCLVAYDRQLSSMVLREMLIALKVAKWRANTMYKSVDLYQKYFCDWEV